MPGAPWQAERPAVACSPWRERPDTFRASAMRASGMRVSGMCASGMRASGMLYHWDEKSTTGMQDACEWDTCGAAGCVRCVRVGCVPVKCVPLWLRVSAWNMRTDK